MANYGYSAEDRSPGRDRERAYTPSHDSEDDLPQVSALTIDERKYRQYFFTKDGRSWVNAVCRESQKTESEIRKKADRQRKPTHSVEALLEKMSPPRRMAIDDLLERTNQKDPNGDDWNIIAIDNEDPQWTKRTGEVKAFSVILSNVSAPRKRANSYHRDRRQSTILSPSQEYEVPDRRASKSYHRANRQSPTGDSRSRTQSQSYRTSQKILLEDPFGTAPLFSHDGKPVDTSGSRAFEVNAGLPEHIPSEQPIGGFVQKEKKDKEGGQGKKSKKGKEDGIIDIDALLGASGLGGRGEHDGDLVVLDDDDHDDHILDYSSPIEVVDDDRRGRKKAGRGYSKTPRQGMSRSRSKSKSKPRRPSIKIPNDQRRPVHEVITSSRRRERPYYGSQGSWTTTSMHSDQSVLEAEYEDYSSSGTSQDPYEELQYVESAGRYPRATNYHRRGPPSPQHPRYAGAPDYHYAPTRRPRAERFVSDGAIERYQYSAHPSQRQALVRQEYIPRFESEPLSAHPPSAYPRNSYYNTLDSGMTPSPAEVDRRRRDSIREEDAIRYMRGDRDKDMEIEILRRERDEAHARLQLAQVGMGRRESVSRRTAGGGARYTHEPRQQRRYTESQAYHG